MKRTPLRKKSKNPTKKLQKECDDLLTPIIVKRYPRCLLCGKPTQVAHHHCHKSKSNRLRHDLINLINLCNSCHFALHNNESYYASKIIQIKGLEWFNQIEKLKRESIRCDLMYYQKTKEMLLKELEYEKEI